MEQLLSTKEAAEILGVSPATLTNWRNRTLFGVPFFTADEQHGGTWYYYRERVDQLKAIYQPGILQNMYKLAYNFPYSENTPADDFQKSVSSLQVNHQHHHGYLTAEQVADLFGVTVQSVQQWVMDETIHWDRFDHRNRWLFKLKTVEDFAARRERQKNSTRRPTPMRSPNYDAVNPTDYSGNAQIDDVSGEKKSPITTTDAGEQNDKVQNKFNLDFTTSDSFGQLPADQFGSVYLQLTKLDLENAQAHRHELPADAKRGLTDETLAHFHVGYLPDWIVTHCRAKWICGTYVDEDTGEIKKLPPKSRRIIVPTDDNEHFNAVALPADRKRTKKKYWKQHAGTMKLFGDKKSVADAEIVLVVEGEFDCMSIWQCSGGKVAVVAILGCANAENTLMPHLSTFLKGKKMILLLDGDESGRKNSDKLRAKLIARGVPAVSCYLYDEISPVEGKKDFDNKVDANEFLIRQGDAFLKNLITRIIDGARDELNKVKAEIAQRNLFDTSNTIAGSVNQSSHDDKKRSDKQPTSNTNTDNQPARDGKSISGNRTKKTAQVVTAEIINIARAALDVIPVAKLTEDDWTKCIWAGRASGLTLKELDDWSKNDPRYDSKAVKDRWDRYRADEGWTVKFLIETAKEFGFNSTTAQVYLLKVDLEKINQEIADFDKEKIAALEKLRDVEKFDSATVFADEIITAAAIARLTDQKVFSDFRREIKVYGDKHRDEKVSVTDWLSDVKSRANEITANQKSLSAQRNQIKAQIRSLSFIGREDLLQGVMIPAEYSITAEFGIEKVAGEELITVCHRPIVIAEKIKCVDDEITKLVLGFMTATGKWRKTPPTERAIVFNCNRLIDLANSDLPVTSSNAALIVAYLDAFFALNEINLPLYYFVNRGGWHNFNGKDYFIDPRRETIITDDDDKNVTVKIDTSRSEFARHLKSVGSLDRWKQAYLLAKKSPVARLMVAAAVAPPLLKLLGERNFLLYVYAPTRAGKSTAMFLGTSAVGSEKINRSFDATKNGLAGMAADVNDFVFPIDEKQVADNKISEQITALVYALSNGVGRTKLNRDSTIKETKYWRTIVIATGETLLLPDNVTGGANTRLLTVKVPKVILPADDCELIRDTIKENYGLAFPLILEEILQTDRENLRGTYKKLTAAFKEKFPESIPDHRRFMALLTLADAILNSALFGDEITTTDGEKINPIEDATINAIKIFPLIPTATELSDTPREIDFVRSFIGQNQSRFIGGTVDTEKIQQIYGRLRDDDGFTYVAAKTLKDACKLEGFDYRKLVADLVADGFFKPADKLKKNHKTPLATVQKKIGVTNFSCYRIPNKIFDECE